MSRHNRERRKAGKESRRVPCPAGCGNSFDQKIVVAVEGEADGLGKRGTALHYCAKCKRLAVMDGGRLRCLTVAEEFACRVAYPEAIEDCESMPETWDGIIIGQQTGPAVPNQQGG